MILHGLNQAAVLAVLAVLTLLLFRRIFIASQQISPPPKKTNSGKTYRIQGVPLTCDIAHLQSFLDTQNDIAGPVVRSLAIEAHGRTQTATVTFRNEIEPLEKPPKVLRHDSENHKLVISDDFLGLTTLFAPAPEDHQVDIIAISGLGGHAFGSFKERGGQHMWLRDALPRHILSKHSDHPMARVITYGYESAVANSNSMQNLEDLATSFRESLMTLTSSPKAKPLIIVAHSLGGLIVKQALITLAKSAAEDQQKATKAVYGIVFFGVPHDGMDISSLIPMVGDGTNRELIGSISQLNSQVLSMQQRAFPEALGAEGQTEIFCFYETKESPTAQQDQHGQWQMNGPKTLLVTKVSATHCRPWENGPEHICAINRSHSNMVKFGPEDPEYERTRQRLQGLANRALDVQSRLRDKNTKFLVPYNQNPDYIGRSSILDTIQQRFGYKKSQAVQHSRVSLFGLGGVGKTQIALAFAYWIRDNYSDVSVFWVHASSADRFSQAFTSLAEECQIPGHDDPKSDLLMLVRQWLERKHQRRWIMIIDNADNKELFFPSELEDASTSRNTTTQSSSRLGDYLPNCSHGSILITTRDKKAASMFSQGTPQIIMIDKMSQDETEQLLKKKVAEGISAKETESLSARLEHLPLALVQAAAFIQANSISVSEYLQLLNESDDSLVNQLSESFETVGRKKSDIPNEVTTTWIVSFNQVQQQDILASKVLSFISLLDRQAVPKKLIRHYYDKKHNRMQQAGLGEVVKALGTLKAFSFISESKDGTIDMHRLVQLVTRRWLRLQDKYDRYVGHSLEVVSDLFPYGTHETRQDCISYLPHAVAVLQNTGAHSYVKETATASLLSHMAGYFLYRGDWNEAEKSAKQSVKLRREMFGEEHPDTLNSMAHLASTYRNQGRWKEAEELEVRVMETSLRVLGEDHPHTLNSIGNLASTYRKQGRWKEAEELFVRVMETSLRVLGEEHPDTLMSMGSLASTCRNQGRWKEAEELEVRVMETSPRVLGEEHPNTLTSMGNLASTYSNQGRWKEAEELFVRVMETRKRVLGEEHPDTLNSMGNLASTYRNQGRWKEAEELFVRVMETRKRVLGEEHPNTLTSMANLASTYCNQGQWKEAEELEVRVMETSLRVLGEEHPNTPMSMANLAATFWNQGRWKEAEELEVRVMEMRKRVLGEEHPDTLTSMYNLADTWKSQNRWKDAIQLLQDCVRLRGNVLGMDHPDTMSSASALSDWELDFGETSHKFT